MADLNIAISELRDHKRSTLSNIIYDVDQADAASSHEATNELMIKVISRANDVIRTSEAIEMVITIKD